MNYATPPGDTLRETLKTLGITQTELAKRMCRPIKTINEIVRGKARITEHTALQLENFVFVSAEMWMDLETRYRIYIARKALNPKNRRTSAPKRQGSG